MKKWLICLAVLFSAFLFTNKVSAATSYTIKSKTTTDNITYYYPNGYEDMYLFVGDAKYVLIYGKSSSSISVASNGKVTDDNGNKVLYITFYNKQELIDFIFNNKSNNVSFEEYTACYVYQNITYSKNFTNNYSNTEGNTSIISKTLKDYYNSDSKVDFINTIDGLFSVAIDLYDNFIITKQSNGSIRMFTWNSANLSKPVYPYNKTNTSLSFLVEESNVSAFNTVDVSVFNLNENNWDYYKKTSTSTWSYETIIATSTYIYPSDNHYLSYEAGYGIIDNSKEFTINTYDTEFGGDWFGVNYIQGEQDNTVNFYIQDSGILYMNYAKGYEIEKIYYDETLTQEANLNDIVETDTNLYVTWKSKIEINKQIATDLSGNDVITITYDFNKIYNENYTYWISNDGTNYVNITDKLNSNHKYASGVYFAGDYFAMVKDENNETISVHYINIDYYRITPTTEIGKDIDENGNIKPYVILDYSAYKEIKNNIICEYSIDNGNTWIDITKELDINMKYKLYINVGDKVTSRVKTNGNTILPGETGGSNYDVTEDFYNDILINEEKDVLEEFKDLLTNKNDNIFIKFKEVWEAFKDSVLFNYIYILIVGSLIILIIKSAKRN